MNDTNTAPAPLVPLEVDLRGMEFMPLYGDRLIKSSTWIAASPEAKVAAIRLWWHAFAHEVPAASLPDNDQLLAEYAGYGVAIKVWGKVKPQAMRGWVKCSDGRWYHRLVAELALAAWERRVKDREKKKRWREAKDRDGTVPQPQKHDQGDRDGTGTEPGRDGVVPVERESEKRWTERGEGHGDSSVPSAKASGNGGKPPTDPVKEEIWRTGKAILIEQGASRDDAGKFIGKLCQDYGNKLVLEAVRDCAKTTPADAKAWLVARCQERRARQSSKQSALEARNKAVADAWVPPEMRETGNASG